MKPSRDITELNGHSVLVKTTTDHRDPPVGLRGTIEARRDRAGTPVVKIVLDYPDMCNEPSRHGVISLDGEGIERLLAGEHAGIYEYTIDRPLDPTPDAPAAQS